MKPLNVCVTVFNRYDLLQLLIESIRRSDLLPSNIWVVDRGNNPTKLHLALGDPIPGVAIHGVKLRGQCLAAAWNWFIKNVPEERIIASDDIEFEPHALRTFVETEGDFVGLEEPGSSHFACFLIRDSCVAAVGLFDEEISPEYMYYEDCDYGKRMEIAGIELKGLTCMRHANSASLAAKTPEQVELHHKLFQIARANYVRKWGCEPTPGKW